MTIWVWFEWVSVEASPINLCGCGLGGASVEASPINLCGCGLGGASVEASPTHLIIHLEICNYVIS